MSLLTRLQVFWLKQEYAWHMVDAYLADMRGDKMARTEFHQKAWDAQRKMQILRLNKIYGELR